MCHSCCRSGVEAEAEKAVLQGEVQAALDQKDAALGQRDAAVEEQASLQELLASTERRAAAAELGSFANEHTKQASTQIKVRLSAECHIVLSMPFIMLSHSMLDCQHVARCKLWCILVYFNVSIGYFLAWEASFAPSRPCSIVA